ncbi:MAG: arginase family protein [Bacteroidetes bacterium]|nr:arginase family protein [Bacteroidota bacterium]MBS1757525.1 arginase family protein [Bacteroidota bacterium]
MKHFKFYSKKDILSLTKVRRFETKLGERVQYLKNEGEWPDVLQQSSAKYVLLGIPEDIGIKANYGIGGADTNWYPFLHSFLNIQSNDFFTGDEVLLLGHFDFGDLKYLIENNAYNQDELIDAYRHAVNIIDEEVEKLIKAIASLKKIPIVIGGGHNNAYPIIKGVAKGLHKTGVLPLAQINCINLDAHSDYRTMEGRHSGNSFRYAEADGYLGKYYILGLHENYVQQNVLTDIHANPFVQFCTYEDIFIHEKKNFIQSIAHATGYTEDTYTGIEMDMDSIQHTLSSARTPAGITSLHARQYINFAATDCKVAYLHIGEAACQLSDGVKDDITGKLISYLVSDFVKANSQI